MLQKIRTVARTAAAFYIPGFQIKHATRLTDNLTIFTAELTAIKLAVLWQKENENRFSKTQNIVIVSDSLSALKASKTCKSMGSPSLLNEVLDLVDRYQSTMLNFCVFQAILEYIETKLWTD